MTSSATEVSRSSGPGGTTVAQAVTVIMGTVVGLTFMFGFGNVLNLALRLGVPVWVAPLVAPAVDLSILGLLLGIRQLALAGATLAQLRPAHRLLIFASAVTLALNVADPLVAGEYGKAAFDAVGPLLLIGWAEVGPELLRALTSASRTRSASPDASKQLETPLVNEPTTIVHATPDSLAEGQAADSESANKRVSSRASRMVGDDLLERARKEDVCHWEDHHRPISAETLRRKLRIGAARSRLLVAMIRTDPRRQSVVHDEMMYQAD